MCVTLKRHLPVLFIDTSAMSDVLDNGRKRIQSERDEFEKWKNLEDSQKEALKPQAAQASFRIEELEQALNAAYQYHQSEMERANAFFVEHHGKVAEM